MNRDKEAIEVKIVLGMMIKEAIEHEYVAKFLDSNIYPINKLLYKVLYSLYEQYGQVQRQDFKIVEREVENINYDPTQPLSAAWKAIENLQKLSIAARLKYSYERLIELAII